MTTMLDESKGDSQGASAAAGPRRWRPRAVTLAVLAALLVGLSAYAVTTRKTAAPVPKGAITEAVMEDRYGVRVDLVALTALGGLLQLRFTVLDKDKAEKLFHTDKPNLLVEATGTTLTPPTDAAHKMVLLNGAGYFLLYANAGDVVHTGDKVSVTIDGVSLQHLVVKS